MASVSPPPPAPPVPRALTDAVPPWALVLSGAVSVQLGAAIAIALFDHAGAATVCALRLLGAGVILLAAWRPSVRALSREQRRLVLTFGLVLGLMNLTFYEALERVPLGVAVTIEFVGPLGVAVIGSRRRADLGLAALAAVGIVLLADPSGGRIDTLGILFALLAGVCWAGYILITRAAGQAFTGGRGLALASGLAWLVPLPFALGAGGAGQITPHVLVLGALVGLMSSAIPYSLETAALRRMPTNVFGILLSLDPAVAALAGFVALGQGLRAVDVAAIGCVVVASVGVTRGAPG